MKLIAAICRNTIIGLGGALMLFNAGAQEPKTVDGDSRQLDAEVQRQPRGAVINLRLPNLHPSKIHFQTGLGFDAIEGGPEVLVDVQNQGEADSQSWDVLLSVAVINPNTGGRKEGPSQVFRKTFPGLAAGARRTFYVGELKLPNRTQDWELGMQATVDPNRQVRESDEGDNVHYYRCWIYGSGASSSSPAPNVPAC